MSELRTEINAFPDDGADADRDKLTSEYASVESQYRAAMITDADDANNDDAPTGGNLDPQEREIGRLLDRVGVTDYLDAAFAGRAPDGAAAELRAAALGDNAPAEYMPLDILLPRAGERQYRVDAVTNIATAIQENQSTIAGRVFPIGALDYLGAERPTVPFGTQSYVSLTSGGSADFRR